MSFVADSFEHGQKQPPDEVENCTALSLALHGHHLMCPATESALAQTGRLIHRINKNAVVTNDGVLLCELRSDFSGLNHSDRFAMQSVKGVGPRLRPTHCARLTEFIRLDQATQSQIMGVQDCPRHWI